MVRNFPQIVRAVDIVVAIVVFVYASARLLDFERSPRAKLLGTLCAGSGRRLCVMIVQGALGGIVMVVA